MLEPLKVPFLHGGTLLETFVGLVHLLGTMYTPNKLSSHSLPLLHIRKPFKDLYRSPMDFGLNACVCKCIICIQCDRSLLPYMQWLEKEFISYLDQWEESVHKREGFSKEAKLKVLLSPETHLSLIGHLSLLRGYILCRHV